ncbi:YbaB/EbfC family nucleoid-associated protein [Segniliparus rugosus]|uniref:YbaB/EbfC DNA-binding family protein n=1 Tax=Segniliparus rugosus (strain ATCC BAA-974 / DSM 45345 / CCUG 50838 / CIP 108380 / JCM 13579 / CDC 945) TaxID=679197 RepID=U1M125_SEGRC|nr:YbaB/EbfC family nucleoid-associated protein [Segniliparus rugosus]ERG69107.1 hypothetical protein HMPREF9336_04251 [Segniliparus rugosus ATCC BAA-974]
MSTSEPAFEDRLEAWAKQAEQAQARLAQVRGKGTAVDGYLVITVDAAGKMLSMTTDTPVSGLHHEDVQSAVMRAYRAACADAEKQAGAITAELYKDPEIRDVLSKANPSAKLPEPPRAAPSAPEIDDDEWNDASAWLRKA